MGSLLWRLRGERLLFRSRRAPFQVPQCGEGRVLEHDGAMFVVTRWVELPPTYNARGGSIPEWDVWGRPARSQEVAAAMAEAAGRILVEAEQRDSAAKEGSAGSSGVVDHEGAAGKE